jgi:hypothetical protein
MKRVRILHLFVVLLIVLLATIELRSYEIFAEENDDLGEKNETGTESQGGFVHFAPVTGHWCVFQRPAGGYEMRSFCYRSLG